MGIKNKKQLEPNKKATGFEPEKQTFKEHLRALRSRLLWLGGSMIVAAIIGFEFKDIIQGLIAMQLADMNLFNLNPADDILSTVQISSLTAVLSGLPLAAYHAYRFLEPMLNRGSSYATKLFSASVTLVAAAVAFSFIVTIPLALHGMVGQGQDASLAHVSTQSFLSFAVTNVIVTAVLFQVPLAIIFTNSVQPLTKKKRAWLQRTIIPAAVIAAWVATPFTTINRGIVGILAIAVPAVLLFEGSLLWAKKHANEPAAPQSTNEKPVAETTAEVVEQPVAQPQAAAYAFVAPKTVLETEQLDPFPDEMFDAMLQDKDDPDESDPAFAPLPPSLEVMADEPDNTKAEAIPTAAPVLQQPAAPTVKPVIATVQSAPKPAVSQLTPRFTPSYSAVHRPLPQPIIQPQPATKKIVYSQQIKETVKSRQTAAPSLRSLHAPQPTIPFQMSPARPYGHTIEGLLPA